MSEPARPTLEYAKARSRAWRWVQRVVLILVMLSVVAAAWCFGPAWWRLAQFRYWRHACLTYDAPADRVIFETDSQAAAALIGHHGYAAGKCSLAGYPPWALAPIPKCVGNALGVPPISATTLFLHRRTTAEGRECLLHVYLDAGPAPMRDPADAASFFFATDLYDPMPVDPAQLNAMPQMPPGPAWMGLRMAANDRTLKIFAGQPDPADDSHFSIVYEIAGRRGTIDGWLKDSGAMVTRRWFGPTTRPPATAWSYVVLSIRDGPALGPFGTVPPVDVVDAGASRPSAKSLVDATALGFGIWDGCPFWTWKITHVYYGPADLLNKRFVAYAYNPQEGGFTPSVRPWPYTGEQGIWQVSLDPRGKFPVPETQTEGPWPFRFGVSNGGIYLLTKGAKSQIPTWIADSATQLHDARGDAQGRLLDQFATALPADVLLWMAHAAEDLDISPANLRRWIETLEADRARNFDIILAADESLYRLDKTWRTGPDRQRLLRWFDAPPDSSREQALLRDHHARLRRLSEERLPVPATPD